ncbi:MAG: tRNA uridine-5-carboxymethylaminomethyl(34) synthesis enzyme MnmG [Desulfobacterales bacterium]|nr:tRNA uridine-5-carboxymethylaminomethyl(34) synthesis enzyme MnmG [Desulfobacterales bacterium]
MTYYQKKYDIIVVGAGHAGCEAALAASRMGCEVLLLTIDLDKIAAMPCSPSIGGMAKGQLVKEIDALGGEMAKITDQSAIQYKILNMSKGPAVRSTRTQNDKLRYRTAMISVIENQQRLDVKQAMVDRIIVENQHIVGIEDHTGFCFQTDAVVLCTGTFLSGLIHIGTKKIQAGRAGEFASYPLATQLKELGFQLGRMKTGTPPRLNKHTIDFSQFEIQEADDNSRPFSMFTASIPLIQHPCYMGYTNAVTHQIVRHNLSRSALYSGQIKGISARYCPSFEDKIVKFPERERHHVILEPEGLENAEIYASGLGNSLPIEIQVDIVRSIKGLESAEIMRPAYAIEYDYVHPTQLTNTLESKKIHGLFMAGQINGTSGYEEAAAQGLWAGINAACAVQKRPKFVLDRSQAYMSVLVDDLVTKGTREPYRMFTSRAEYRLMLREDNADSRLTEIGYELGLVTRSTLDFVKEKQQTIDKEISRIRSTILKPTDQVNHYLTSKGVMAIHHGIPLDQMLKRPMMDYDIVQQFYPSEQHLNEQIIKQVEIEIKYEGYIQKQLKEIEQYRHYEKIKISPAIDYTTLDGLSNEIKEKLQSIKPATLAQASRIDGMTPAALSILRVYLKTFYIKNNVTT